MTKLLPDKPFHVMESKVVKREQPKSRVKIIQGDIFEAKSDYIAHQCNCITSHAAGFALEVFKRFPESNDYKSRNIGRRNQPGTITIRGGSEADPSLRGKIINMFAQYHPGKAEYINDSPVKRLTWFRECLELVGKLVRDESSIAFPYKIGCNLAGGNWPDYLKTIEDFAERYPKLDVTIYQPNW
jgi:O-acetyl-ADP-ribose deacetylase (regulator of RNase III)